MSDKPQQDRARAQAHREKLAEEARADFKALFGHDAGAHGSGGPLVALFVGRMIADAVERDC
jgi:hypothetical protein